jgi:hypothetical protein
MTIFEELSKFHKEISPKIENADITDVKDCLKEIHRIQIKLSKRYAEISTVLEQRDRMNRPSKILQAVAKEKEELNNDRR